MAVVGGLVGMPVIAPHGMVCSPRGCNRPARAMVAAGTGVAMVGDVGEDSYYLGAPLGRVDSAKSGCRPPISSR